MNNSPKMKTRWIALLRGVGPDQLSTELAGLLAPCGLERVKICPPDNIVFESEQDMKALEGVLKRVFRENFRLRPKLVVLESSRFQAAATENPFQSESESTSECAHVLFLRKRPVQPNFEQMERFKAKEEAWSLSDAAFYLTTPNGFWKSQLGARAERLLGVIGIPRTRAQVREILKALE